MKRIQNTVVAMLAGLFLAAVTVPAIAAEGEKTITGVGKCAKCDMHKTEKCQNVLEVEGKNGKVTDYFIADNEVSKDFHKNICKENKKVKVTGTVKKGEDGKKEIVASKIELAE